MSIGLDIIGLLYRADWTRLSLAAEVSVTRERGPFASDDGDDDGLESGRPPAGVLHMLFSDPGRRDTSGRWSPIRCRPTRAGPRC
jgi:hypothetical protein